VLLTSCPITTDGGDSFFMMGMLSITSVNSVVSRGVATGGISVYIPPKSVYLTNFYVVTGCFVHMSDINMF